MKIFVDSANLDEIAAALDRGFPAGVTTNPSILAKEPRTVNCTCCMSYNQAVMAASAGANYVSLFYGRIRDTGYDARSVVEAVAKTFHARNVPAEVIVGSIRHIVDVNEALQAGADIVTVPPQLFKQLVSHPQTDAAVSQFLNDFQRWLGKAGGE
jgi:transaldolase